jgi:dienelactone hydrolase
MHRLLLAAAVMTIATPFALPFALSFAPTPSFELPAPTGPYAVGTTTWRLTDRSRQETLSGSHEFRQVEVLAWYPASPRGTRLAPYLREGLTEVRSFAKNFGNETAFDGLEGVRTHAELDAVPAVGPQKFPVLIFSHGYTGLPSSYTGLLEDLASHGYAVLSIVHPYEATAATLADGRIVSMVASGMGAGIGAGIGSDDGAFLPAVQDVLAEWDAEDETMAAVTRATDDREQLRLLRGYLGGLHHTDVALRRWVDDMKLVLDRLSGVPASTAAGQLASRLDVGRLGVFGHSMGGVAAGQFCVEDRRCRAGLNLDGVPQYGTMIDKSMPHPFLMVYSARPGRGGASDAIYRRAAQPYYRVDVQGTRHLDFSDIVFWGGPLRERPVLGDIAPARVSEITRTIVRQYFGQELLGQRSPLLAGERLFPEVTAKIVAPAR